MKLSISAVLFSLLVAAAAHPDALPGFRAERLGPLEGFPTSIAIDSAGRFFYTTTSGGIYRWSAAGSVRLATVETDGTGNSGLLGMALLDDLTAVVHYTTPQQTYDVVSTIDLQSGSETILHRFAGDVDLPGRPTPSEHHGGNPTLAPDGAIFVGIGDYSWSFIAPDDRWNGGKIFRITRDGTVTRFARGLRNPFDMAWDPESERLIVADNGPVGGDEIHIIEEGAYCGWPHTYGTLPPVEGAVVPDYVFPDTTAPTGLLLLSGTQPHLRSGILLGGFVTRAIYYFPDLDERPIDPPLTLIEKETPPVIDIAQADGGAIYFVTGGFASGSSALWRLHPPLRGDCNGDGRVDIGDRDALAAELVEGSLQRVIDVHGGSHRASWGCDADLDGFVTAADAVELNRMLGWRRRVVGR